MAGGKENLDVFERGAWDGGIHGRLGFRVVAVILGKTSKPAGGDCSWGKDHPR